MSESAASKEPPPDFSALSGSIFDVVLFETNLRTSILSAALSKQGLSVLHIDSANHYGAESASLNYTLFRKHIDDVKGSIEFGDNFSDTFFKSKSNEFSFDLQTKLLLSKSLAIDVIVKSEAYHYLGFRACSEIFHYSQNSSLNKTASFYRVPTSKQQVFASNALSRVHKRRLMKLLHLVLDDAHSTQLSNTSAININDERNFNELLIEFGLDQYLRNFILFALCGVSSTCTKLTTRVALHTLQLLLTSVGTHSSGAYLYPVYGMGDISQAFCRLAAVHSATYILRAPHILNMIHYNQYTVSQTLMMTRVALDETHYVLARHVVVGEQYSSMHTHNTHSQLSRCIVVSTKSLHCVSPSPRGDEDDESDVRKLSFAPGTINNTYLVRGIHLSCRTQVCPNGFFVTHFSTSEAEINAENILRAAVNACFDTHDQCFTAFWTTASSSINSCRTDFAANAIIMPYINPHTLDVDEEFVCARKVFTQLCPNADFFTNTDEHRVRDRDEFGTKAFESFSHEEISMDCLKTKEKAEQNSFHSDSIV